MKPDNDPQYSFIPALPGWFLMQPVQSLQGDEIVEFIKEPVLAWEISSEIPPYSETKNDPLVIVCPVTVCGVSRNFDLLQRPDGTFTRPEDMDYENEADALKDANERLRKV